VLDQCNVAALTNNNGTTSWSGGWTEIGESNGAGSGNFRIGVSDLGSNRMCVASTNCGARRQVNLSGCSTAVLSFIYRRVGPDNTNDYVTVGVSSNAGSSWIELGRFMGPTTDTTYRATSYNITSYAKTNTQIRFLSSPVLATNDYVYFDDIQILFTK
jgi:MSHA biogenesis protein MshQ